MAYIIGFPVSFKHLVGEYPPGMYLEKADSSVMRISLMFTEADVRCMHAYFDKCSLQVSAMFPVALLQASNQP